jgi:hypothetical protein
MVKPPTPTLAPQITALFLKRYSCKMQSIPGKTKDYPKKRLKISSIGTG